MIDEQTLAAMLAEVADGVELPDGGLDAALAGMRTGVGQAPAGDSGRSRFRRPLPAVAAALLLVVLAVSVTLVVGHRSSSGPAGSAASAGSSNALGNGLYPAQTQGAAAAGTASTPAVAAPMVVRTASVKLQVKAGATSGTLTRISGLATGVGGYVQDSTSVTTGATPTGSMTLRIPSADYTRIRNALTAGDYGTVESLQERGTDVTAQYTDLGARLDALIQTRASYLALLGRAGSIPDVLAVQAQLSSVQQQIESLQGQRKVLADHADDATIAVVVSGPPVAVTPHHDRSGWATAFSRAGHGLVHDLQAIVARTGGGLVVLVGLALLAALALLGTRLVRRRLI